MQPPPADCSAPEATTPSLAMLSVTAAADSSVTLVPAFSPGIHDYYVRCSAGMNALSVSMTASTDAESVLVQPSGSGSSASAEQTLSLRVNENQAIVAAAMQGTATTEYWVRCLPHDFAEMQWDVHSDGCTRKPGYYLLGNNWPVTDQTVAYAMVLDMNGVPVWYYKEEESVTGEGVYNVDSLAEGAISFIPSPSASPWLPWEIHQLSPRQTIGIGPAGPDLDNHELRVLRNGNYLLFTVPIETGFDLTGLSLAEGGALGPNSNIASCKVLEVEPKRGSVVWSWDIADHFNPADDTTYATTGATDWHAPDGGPVYDVFHCNSIDVDPANQNLLVSARNLDSVFYVDRSTSKVLWKMGGSTASKDSALYVPVEDPFYRQHDARLQPGWSTSCGGSGQVSMFDDESEHETPARAVVYDVDVGAPSSGTGSCGTAKASVAWQYAGAVSSEYMGSFRITSDGSRVIDWGTGGTTALVFTEVDVAGNDLLDLRFLPGGSSYRAVKVPLSTFNLGDLRSTSGQ
jgi:hypothetical protein